jgi:hypothetical protein
MKTIEVKISGSGTKAELLEALSDISDMINSLTDSEIENGGDLENSILHCEYDELFEQN